MNLCPAERDPRESLMLPPAFVPAYVREIGKAARDSCLAQAVTEVYDDANIRFEVEGLNRELEEGQGLLIASDHRQGIEPWLVQGLVRASGHPASHVVGAPTSRPCRQIDSISDPEDRLILPVIPGTFAAEKKPSELRAYDRYARLRYPSIVRPRHELRAINACTIREAADLLSEGSAVTMFPTGGTDDATKTPWRRGIGSIIRELPTEARERTRIVVSRPDKISRSRLVASLSLGRLGIKAPSQTFVLRAADIGTPVELFDSYLSSDDPDSAQHITDVIRDQYLENFGP